MAKAIFTTKISPSYDDVPEEKYHFPKTYLNQVKATVGDSIIYYEPRRSGGSLSSSGGRSSYFAVARVESIDADPQNEKMFYARISNYLNFIHPVPFREGDTYFESLTKREDGQTSKGAFGRSVRRIPDNEFDMILKKGFSADIGAFATPDLPTPLSGFSEEQALFERPMIETTLSRPFRDQAFRHSVRDAYDKRCAITGLRLINGGGHPEVEAAHIKPVQSGGSDSIRNGLALSGTVHWMFDRGLISISNNFELIAPKKFIPSELSALIIDGKTLYIPDDDRLRPHPVFLEFHRENIFKG